MLQEPVIVPPQPCGNKNQTQAYLPPLTPFDPTQRYVVNQSRKKKKERKKRKREDG
jgi:hypothetical protein